MADDVLASNSNNTQQASVETIENSLRHPDFAILDARWYSDNDVGSPTVRSSKCVERIELPLLYSKRLPAIDEVSSGSTRLVDLCDKWESYALSEIPVYIIFDRGPKSGIRERRFIIGSLEPFSDSERSTSGDRLLKPIGIRRMRANPGNVSYYRKVFKENDCVDFPFYKHLKIKVFDFFDLGKMARMATHMENDRARQRYQKEEERSQKEKEKRQRKEEKSQKEEQISQKEEQTSQKEKQKSQKEKQRRQKEEQRRQKEEQRRQKEEERCQRKRNKEKLKE